MSLGLLKATFSTQKFYQNLVYKVERALSRTVFLSEVQTRLQQAEARMKHSHDEHRRDLSFKPSEPPLLLEGKVVPNPQAILRSRLTATTIKCFYSGLAFHQPTQLGGSWGIPQSGPTQNSSLRTGSVCRSGVMMRTPFSEKHTNIEGQQGKSGRSMLQPLKLERINVDQLLKEDFPFLRKTFFNFTRVL